MASILSQLQDLMAEFEAPSRPGELVFSDGHDIIDFDKIDFNNFDDSFFIEYLETGEDLFVQWSGLNDDDDYMSPPIQVFLPNTQTVQFIVVPHDNQEFEACVVTFSEMSMEEMILTFITSIVDNWLLESRTDELIAVDNFKQNLQLLGPDVMATRDDEMTVTMVALN